MERQRRQQQPHVLFIPFPVQGHVAPLMKLAHWISDHGGTHVTFVNSHFIHDKLMAFAPPEVDGGRWIRLVSIPDGLDPDDDRRDIPKLKKSFERVMPDRLKDLIEKVNGNSNDDDHGMITCVIADITVGGWAMEVAEKMGIQAVPFCPLGPGTIAWTLHIPELLQAGLINSTDGSPLKDELICLSKEIPVLSRNKKLLPWSCPGNPGLQELIFRIQLSIINQIMDFSYDLLLCNCFYELDPYACQLVSPKLLPIGPLLASDHRDQHYAGNLWPEDLTCISWLDRHPAGSVVYVAFGSLAVLAKPQLDELALGLELAGRPFLWVVRSDSAGGSAAEFPDGFTERVSVFGKIVSWAPQEEVLAHPSVACFLSHCGWNSTMDGVSMGVPFLCWPSFGDQLLNQAYICERWKVGLGLNPYENGFISRHEIKEKIEDLVSDDGIKANAQRLKEMARKSVSEGGSSYNNFRTLMEAIEH